MKIRAGIIGAGAIASCLKKRLLETGHYVTLEVRRDRYTVEGVEHDREGRTLTELLETAPVPNVIFLAIPTLDSGEAARDYLRACAQAGIRAITCEKGALAHHFDALVPHRRLIGFSASVGGGTGMLPYLARRKPNNQPVQIHAVLNGTLNFIFDETGHGGRSLGEACNEARRLGYAEPGSMDALGLINGELRDVLMKTCVLFNAAFAKTKYLVPHDLGGFMLDATALEELGECASGYRLVVTMANHPLRQLPYFRDLTFGAHLGGWQVQGGFRLLTGDADLASWLPGGVGNALHVIEGELGSGGKYTLSGPGAGVEPTTTAMLNDLWAMV